MIQQEISSKKTFFNTKDFWFPQVSDIVWEVTLFFLHIPLWSFRSILNWYILLYKQKLQRSFYMQWLMSVIQIYVFIRFWHQVNLLVDASVAGWYHLQVHSPCCLRWTAGVQAGYVPHYPLFGVNLSNSLCVFLLNNASFDYHASILIFSACTVQYLRILMMPFVFIHNA